MKILRNKTKIVLLSFSVLALIFLGASGSNDKGKTNRLSKTTADFFVFNINNLFMPLDNKGVIGDVDPGGGVGAGGKFDGKIFLFSGGFYVSGLDNGNLWSNGVLSASRIEDYQPGPVGSSQTDPKNRVYVVSVQDPAFGTSWQDWKDAVSIGADYYDGDGDGVYNPVDKNGNGIWDLGEDRPDLIADLTVWSVFNDGVPKAQRRYTDVDPKGIEIHQSVFGFASKGVVGNMLFIRYRLINKGTKAERFDSVYFSVAADPDLGDYTDDLVGCDTAISAGFVYNKTPDGVFGQRPPCFLLDFFQGPVSFIPGETYTDVNANGIFDAGDIPLDTAYNVRGKVLGIDTIPGAKNLGLSSFTQYMQSHPTHGDPNTRFELRNYMLGGRGRNGDPIFIGTWTFGNGATLGADTLMAPKYMYSGNPEPQTGWLNTTPIDQRQMSNAGPFTLEKNKPIDIVVAYVAGQGTSPLNGVTVAKQYSNTAQLIFDSNFPSPPPPPPIVYDVRTGEDFIDVTWETSGQIKYRQVDNVLDIDRRFQGFYVTSFRTNSKALSISGIENAKEIAWYDLRDSINNVYQKQSNGGVDLARKEGFKLDSLKYADPTQGRIRLTISSDPFTGGPLVKGKEYYFAITNYTLNHRVISNRITGTYGPAGDYVDNSGAGIDEYETAIIRVVFGSDLYAPSIKGSYSEKTAGASDGAVQYLVADNDKLTGNTYEVSFVKDSASAVYSTFWKLTNKTTGSILLDSSKLYDFDSSNYSGLVTEGFLTKVKPVTASVGTSSYTSANPDWFDEFTNGDATGVYYVGSDIPAGAAWPLIPVGRSTVIGADKLRKVELRFGTNGKAYRYLNGYFGSAITAPNSYRYASGVTATDTVGKGSVGNWDTVNNRANGFVDVPFTAWVVDNKYGEEKQLAVGFIERRKTPAPNFRGNPDGIWDPGDSLRLSFEGILIFDAAYDPNGQQVEYTGGTFGATTVWADPYAGFTIPADAPGVTELQKKVAKSRMFNTMYVVGLQRINTSTFYTNGDKLTIPVSTYPYTSLDKFTFSTLKGGALSADQEKELFNKVNVFPNPLFAYNPATSYDVNANPDDPFVTFSNLPTDVSIKIYTLSGTLVRTLDQNDKGDGVSSPFLRWDLENEAGLRVASGMYFAIVSSPKYGDKILKFGIIMPQKQLQRF